MYVYAELRPTLFTEEGADTLEKIRRQVRKALALAGAVRAQEAWSAVTGDNWKMIAALDYLVEKSELYEVTGPDAVTQHRVYVAGPNAPR